METLLVEDHAHPSARKSFSDTSSSMTGRFFGKTCLRRPSKAFDAPITRGQEIEVFLAQLNLTTKTCSGDFTICGWCGKGVGTTQHWFGECGAWAGDRRELGVRGTADFFRNPAAAHELVARQRDAARECGGGGPWGPVGGIGGRWTTR